MLSISYGIKKRQRKFLFANDIRIFNKFAMKPFADIEQTKRRVKEDCFIFTALIRALVLQNFSGHNFQAALTTFS